MRNLKKVLALVLALVMSLSLVTIANAADFSDDADINYDEAVDVMVAAGIIDGVGNNSFDPKGTLTREQAAKLITYMLMGDNSENLGIESSSFKDVAVTRWSAPAIEYCATMGIIDGAGDGNFYPAGKLTGYAFAKMLLTAIGYDSDIEKFVGNGWTINVASIGMEVGLNNGLDKMFGSAELSRQEAAQMALNAIKAPLVYYPNKGNTVSVNGVVVDFSSQQYDYVTTTIAKEQTISSTTLSNTNETRYTIELGEKYLPKLRLRAGTDDFDRPADAWSYDGKEIGTYVNDDDLAYTAKVKISDIYKDLGLAKSIPEANVTVYLDGKEVNASDLGIDSTAITKSDSAKIGGNGILTQVFYDSEDNTAIITLINTYVGKIASVTPAKGSADRYVTVTTKSTRTDLNTKFETEDFAAKDLITYTCAYNDSTKKYDIVEIENLDKSNTATLTKWTGIDVGNSDNSFTAGETYKYNVNAYVDVDGAKGDIDAFTVDESELDIYCDAYGYAIYVTGVETAKNYAVVIGTGSSNQYGSETIGATLLFADGTQKEVTAKYKTADNGSVPLTKGPGPDASDDSYVKTYNKNLVTDMLGDVVTYKVNKDGIYELTMGGLNGAKNAATGKWDATTYDGDDEVKFVNGRSLLAMTSDSSKTVYTTEKTVFFVATVNSKNEVVYNVYTGYSNMPSLKTGTGSAIKGIAYVMNSDYTTQADAVFIAVPSVKGLSANQTFVVKQEDHEVITNSDGSYFEMPAINADGDIITVKVDAKYLGDDDQPLDNKGDDQVTGVVSMSDVSKDKNDIYTGATFDDPHPSANFSDTKSYYKTTGVVAPANGVIGLGSDNKTSAIYWAYTKSTKFYEVNEDMDTITAISADDIVDDANDVIFFVADDDATASYKVVKTVIVQKMEDGTSSSSGSGLTPENSYVTGNIADGFNVTTNSTPTNYEVAQLLQDYLAGTAGLEKVTYDGSNATITFVDGSTQTATVNVVSGTGAATAAKVMDEIQSAIESATDPADKPDPTLVNVTVEGNTLKVEALAGQGATYFSTSPGSPATHDLARFLGKLFTDADAAEIVYSDVTYTWEDDETINTISGDSKSKWYNAGNGDDIAASTLVGAIIEDFKPGTPASASGSITITVDGAPMNIAFSVATE